jgi:hypothetical protein
VVALGVKIKQAQLVVRVAVAVRVGTVLRLLAALELLVKEIMAVLTSPQYLARLQRVAVAEQERLEEPQQTITTLVLVEPVQLHL